jgi:hypothetical protein
MKRNIIFISGVLGVLQFIVASILGGTQIEGYSFISQYISESYATGIPNSNYLRYMYVACGVLLALFGFMVSNELPKSKGIKIGFILFAIFYGIGTISTGFFPCDLGCNPDPEMASLSQFVHNTSGFLVYAIVPFCLIGIGLASKKMMGASRFPIISIVCGILAFVFVLFLFSDPTGPFRGLIQRVIEGSILFWVLYTSFYVLRKNK